MDKADDDDDEFLKLEDVSGELDENSLKWKGSTSAKCALTSVALTSIPVSITCLAGQLYLGNARAAATLKTLKQYKISHVLSVLDTPIAVPPAVLLKECRYLKVDDKSKEDMIQYFPEFCQWIDSVLSSNPKHRLLVHCFMGVSRSATFVLAYWIWKRYFPTVQHAVAALRSYRSVIQPNPGFVKQLEQWRDLRWIVPVLPTHLPKSITSLSTHISSFLA
jgi:predicted protein tyrosine phosphatase